MVDPAVERRADGWLVGRAGERARERAGERSAGERAGRSVGTF